MQTKNDMAASLGEQTCLASEPYQTELFGDKTQLVSEAYGTVLEVQPQAVPAEAAEEDEELYRIGDFIDNRYEVLAIHRGAWGVVYGAYDHEEELPRALKTIQGKYRNQKKLMKLFEEEAAVWVKLEKHPYIVRAYRVIIFEEQPFVITEYITNRQGNDLRSWLGSSKLTLAVGVEMALKIAQGMQYAHKQVAGLIHRDLKPANILVDEYAQPYITDFGLVNAAGSDAGTPAYMAPEQWRREAITVRADIYAFGCIIYELLTGHRMYNAATADEWRQMHLAAMPAAPRRLKPEIPAGLEEFVLRCLEKDPDRRPFSWDEIVEVLAGWSYQLTGQLPIVDFSAYKLDAGELLAATTSLSNLDKYAEALATCERTCDITPDDFRVWGIKGLLLYGLDRYQEAVNCLDRALELNPSYDVAWSYKGRSLYFLKCYEEAVSNCERALELDQQDENTWYYKLRALEELVGLEEVLDYYDEALEICPNETELWKARGRVLHKLGRSEEALLDFDRALEIDPGFYPAWICKGIDLYALRRYEEALVCNNRALELDPENCSNWFDKGMTLDKLGRYDEAVEAFEEAAKLGPEYAGYYSGKGRSLYHAGRYEEAIVSCDEALAIKPKNNWGWEYKGKSLIMLKRNEEGIACLKRLLEIDPDLDIWDDFSESIIL